jgi:hypothetical protein
MIALRALSLLAVLACSTHATLWAQDAVAVTKVGKFFAVTCEGGDARMAEQALRVVEPVWPLVCAAFGVGANVPEQPLEVVLYRHVDAYLAADRRLTGGKFQPNQAMSHWSSKSAHVALQPACADELLAERGLPLQTQAMLAWEACHIARFTLCANFRIHPGWFQDGLAATTAQQVLHDLYPEMTEQPFFSQRWWRARRLLEAQNMPQVSALLADHTEGLAMRDRYAARIAFFEFARLRHPDKLLAIAKTIRRLGAGSSYAGKVAEEAERLLGPLGDEFAQQVKQRQPAWDEKFRSLWLLGKQWQQTAFADTNALAFCSQPVRGGKIEVAGKVFIYDGKVRQMNFLLAQCDAGFYSLALTAGTGWTLFDYRRATNEWRVVSNGSEPACQAGVDVPFGLLGSGKHLEVRLASRSWQVELPRALPDEIIWGLGAQASNKGQRLGSSGVWRDVVVTGG